MNVDSQHNEELELIKIQLSHALNDALTSKNTLKQFRGRCAELENQLANLNAELVLKETPSSRHFESKIETLKKIVNDQASKIQVIEQQKAVFVELEKALREQNSTLFLGLSDYKKQQDEHAHLVRRISVKEEEQKALQRELTSIEAELAAITAEGASVKEENQRLAQVISELNAGIEAAQREVIEIESRMSTVAAEKDHLANENVRLLDLLAVKEEERKNLNGNYSYEIEKNKKDLSAIEFRLNSAEGLNAKFKVENDQLLQMLADYEQTIAANQKKISQTEEEMAALDSERKSLSVKLKGMTASYEASVSEVARLTQDVAAADSEKEKNSEQIFILKQQLKVSVDDAKAAHQDIARLSAAYAAKEDAFNALTEQHQVETESNQQIAHQFEVKIAKLSREAEASVEEISRLSRILATKEKALHELQVAYSTEMAKSQKTITEITNQLKAVGGEHQVAQSEIARLGQTLAAKEEALNAMNAQIQKEASESRIRLQDLDSKLRSAVAEGKQAKERSQNTIFEIETKLRNVTNELQLSREEVARLNGVVLVKEKSIQDLQTSNYSQQLSLKKNQSEKFEIESKLNASTHENKLITSENTRLAQALSAKEQAFEELSREFQNEIDVNKRTSLEVQTKMKSILQQNEGLKQENKKVVASVPKVSQAVKNREERVRVYSSELQKEKQALRAFAEELLAELTIGAQLNPSRDLLKITEFELSKLEADLIRTPTSSPSRKGMEKAVEQLITQRDFLRSNCENSGKEWSQKIEKLARFTKDLRLEEMPPLPPAAEDGNNEESGHDQKT